MMSCYTHSNFTQRKFTPVRRYELHFFDTATHLQFSLENFQVNLIICSYVYISVSQRLPMQLIEKNTTIEIYSSCIASARPSF